MYFVNSILNLLYSGYRGDRVRKNAATAPEPKPALLPSGLPLLVSVPNNSNIAAALVYRQP